MPVVYACIIPPSRPEAGRITDAFDLVQEELAAQEAGCALVIVPGAAPGASIAIGAEQSDALADAVVVEAQADTLPVQRARCASLPDALNVTLASVRLVTVQTSSLSAREHVALGRAVSRALDREDVRVALVCVARLSTALGPGEPGRTFDARYRRAIEDWDVKWMVGLDSETRRRVAEDCAAQTAVLMGALSSSRIQPRVLAYEPSDGGGLLVAAIDVLGPRRKPARS